MEPVSAVSSQSVDAQLWLRLLQIVGIDILLSGDNALVIALACRSLPPRQQRIGSILGAGGAVALRVVFAFFVISLMQVPLLKVVGGLLLFWIAIKLLMPEAPQAEGGVAAAATLAQAVRIVIVADAVMSLDNVVAVAAAAKGSLLLLSLGLAISIPLIVYGSTLIIRIIARFPIAITAGGGLLGYIAAEVMVTDPWLAPIVEQTWPPLHSVAPPAGALFVVVLGTWLSSRPRRRDSADAARRAAFESGREPT
ncbi:MAG: YjbE family putative metal transport protein [Vicinamibacterales bacterium]